MFETLVGLLHETKIIARPRYKQFVADIGFTHTLAIHIDTRTEHFKERSIVAIIETLLQRYELHVHGYELIIDTSKEFSKDVALND